MKVLRLVKDDVPIRGRLIDLQGRPVAGATIQLVGILWHPSGKLDEWLEALKTEKVGYPVPVPDAPLLVERRHPVAVPGGHDRPRGRFTLKGVGRERIASLLISGPGIETLFEFAATRDMPTVKVADFDRQNHGHDITYHGAACDLVAGPGLEIVGTVRDKDTGKPLAGVTVQTTAAFGNPLRFLKTKTDAEGRYRLPGLPPKTDLRRRARCARHGEGRAGLPAIGPARGGRRGPGPDPQGLRAEARGLGARAGHRSSPPASRSGRASATTSSRTIRTGRIIRRTARSGSRCRSMPMRTANSRSPSCPAGASWAPGFGNDTYRLAVGIDKIKGHEDRSRSV